jgi:serine/threonine protein kinase/Tfp pilus assembly protein PilF
VTKDSLIGKTLGQYVITARIGSGGMATVYRAHQPTMSRDVAIKMIKLELANENEQLYQRFEREVKLIGSLEHLHILPVFDYGADEQHTYLVMRAMSHSLEHYLKHHHPIPPAEVSRLLKQIASALDFAHEKGVIHRDIKSANILMDNDNNAYLADFGIAALMSATHSLTGEGMMVGTPGYMAPELWQGESASPQSDIYAVGVMLYEMLVGRLPFQAETPYLFMYKHLNDPIPTLADQRTDLPPDYDALLQQVLAKQPQDRYQTATELAENFATLVRNQSTVTKIDAPPTPDLTETTPSPVLPPSQPAPAHHFEQPTQILTAQVSPTQHQSAPFTLLRAVRRYQRPLIIILFVGVVAAAIAGIAWMQRPDAGALNALGTEALAVLEYDSAIAYFEQALEHDPDYAAAYFNLGVAYEERGDLLAARDAYQNAVRIDSTLLLARYRLAALLLDVGEVNDGFQTVDEGVRVLNLGNVTLDDATRDTLTYLLYVTRGRAYWLREEYALALADLQQALATQYDYTAEAHYYTALIHTDMGDDSAAEQAWFNLLATYDTNNERHREWATEARTAIEG